jgi:uncharacterized protein YjbI with pentapeptide repeats
MANQEHLDLLKKGVKIWNQWREEDQEIGFFNDADLTGADLSGNNFDNFNFTRAHLEGAHLERAHLNGTNLYEAALYKAHLSGARLSGADLRGADLSGADLTEAYLDGADLTTTNLSGARLFRTVFSSPILYEFSLKDGGVLNNAETFRHGLMEELTFSNGARLNRTNLSGADLSSADLSGASLSGADLSGTNLSGANLCRAFLWKTNFSGANLGGANLSGATLVRTNFAEATLTDCHIYGIAAWGVELKGARQSNLIISRWDEPIITVDNLKLAQFIYLLLNNSEIREVIDTITSKVVLILGRFTPERKAVLDALREELRKRNYSPVLFDFDKPASRDLTGTVSTLAHLARFIIVDLTDPSSAPHEVATVIPQTVVPVQPVILGGEREYSMFRDLRQRYHWVLPTYSYADQAHLLATLQEHVIAPAEQKAQELEKR